MVLEEPEEPLFESLRFDQPENMAGANFIKCIRYAVVNNKSFPRMLCLQAATNGRDCASEGNKALWLVRNFSNRRAEAFASDDLQNSGFFTQEVTFAGMPDPKQRYTFALKIYVCGDDEINRGMVDVSLTPRPGKHPERLTWPIKLAAILLKAVKCRGTGNPAKATFSPRGSHKAFFEECGQPKAGQEEHIWGSPLVRSQELEEYIINDTLLLLVELKTNY